VLKTDLDESKIELPDKEMLAALILRYMAKYERTSLGIKKQD
jgi:hypothetical protein